MAARFERTYRWHTWSGTIEELGSAAQEAEKTVTAWIGSNPEVHITAQIGGLQDTGLTLDELQQMPESQLRNIHGIRIRIGHYTGPSATISVQPGVDNYPLVMIVQGDELDRVEGLGNRLTQMLVRGVRRINWFDRVWITATSFCLAIALALVLADTAVNAVWRLRLASQNQRWEPAEVLAVGVAVLVAIGAWTGTIWLFPDLELHLPGQGTRWKKFRAIAVTLGLSLLSAAIYDLLRHFL